MSVEYRVHGDSQRCFYKSWQIGFDSTRQRCLLMCEPYDSIWAKSEGLNLKENEILVRVENSLTSIEEDRNGKEYVSMASIAKVDLKTGSIAFTEGEEGVDIKWGRKTRNTTILYRDRVEKYLNSLI